MTVPALVKTWGYDVSNVETFTTDTELGQKMQWNIKEALVTAGWSVVASCNGDGITAVKNIGDPSPDLWVAYTDVIQASVGAHSWVALYNSTMDLTFLIDCLATNVYSCDIAIIDGAVNADGTTALRPTTVTGVEKFYSNLDTGPGRPYSATQFVWHAWYSTDNKAFRFAARSNGSNPGHVTIFIQEPSNVPDLWLDPAVFAIQSNASTDVSWTNLLFYQAKITLVTRVNGVMTHLMYISSESHYNGDDPSSRYVDVSPRDLSSDAGYLMCPMGLIGNDVGVRGSNGRIDDMWWGPGSMVIGDTIIESGSRDFICFAEFMLPWNDTVPVIS